MLKLVVPGAYIQKPNKCTTLEKDGSTNTRTTIRIGFDKQEPFTLMLFAPIIIMQHVADVISLYDCSCSMGKFAATTWVLDSNQVNHTQLKQKNIPLKQWNQIKPKQIRQCAKPAALRGRAMGDLKLSSLTTWHRNAHMNYHHHMWTTSCGM